MTRLATTHRAARPEDLRNTIFPSRKVAEERGSRSLLTTIVVDGVAVVVGLGLLWVVAWMAQFLVHP